MYKVTFKNKSPPKYPATTWQKVDQTARNLEYRKDGWTSKNGMALTTPSCRQLKQKLMTLMEESQITPGCLFNT